MLESTLVTIFTILLVLFCGRFVYLKCQDESEIKARKVANHNKQRMTEYNNYCFNCDCEGITPVSKDVYFSGY